MKKLGVPQIIGRDQNFRSTDKIRENRDPKSQAFLDNAQTYKKDVVGDWMRKTGRSKQFGGFGVKGKAQAQTGASVSQRMVMVNGKCTPWQKVI
ncbi:MAG TPA: hypothetical protein VMY42_08785 [Thermoguttaceae bacterium]|nr:hypothetical protein [Thermoguttaceae bacterium]